MNRSRYQSVNPRIALATAALAGLWIVEYLVTIQSQRTELGSPDVVFPATFAGVMAALSAGAAVIRDRDIRLAQALLYAAAGGLLPAGVLGLASIGLPLIVAGLLALVAAGSRLIPLPLGVTAAVLSTSAFFVGVALTIRVS